MSWTERTCLLLALLLALPFLASAQWEDEEEACSALLEGKSLKLYEKGINGSKYDRAERVAFLEEALRNFNKILEYGLVAWLVLVSHKHLIDFGHRRFI